MKKSRDQDLFFQLRLKGCFFSSKHWSRKKESKGNVLKMIGKSRKLKGHEGKRKEHWRKNAGKLRNIQQTRGNGRKIQEIYRGINKSGNLFFCLSSDSFLVSSERWSAIKV